MSSSGTRTWMRCSPAPRWARSTRRPASRRSHRINTFWQGGSRCPGRREPAETKTAATNPEVQEKTSPGDEVESPPLVEKKYQLQVGSFKSNGQAKKFCTKITSLGYDPQIVMVELPKQGKWFRVVINDFPTRDEAKVAAGVLSEKIKGISYMIRPNK